MTKLKDFPVKCVIDGIQRALFYDEDIKRIYVQDVTPSYVSVRCLVAPEGKYDYYEEYVFYADRVSCTKNGNEKPNINSHMAKLWKQYVFEMSYFDKLLQLTETEKRNEKLTHEEKKELISKNFFCPDMLNLTIEQFIEFFSSVLYELYDVDNINIAGINERIVEVEANVYRSSIGKKRDEYFFFGRETASYRACHRADDLESSETTAFETQRVLSRYKTNKDYLVANQME